MLSLLTLGYMLLLMVHFMCLSQYLAYGILSKAIFIFHNISLFFLYSPYSYDLFIHTLVCFLHHNAFFLLKNLLTIGAGLIHSLMSGYILSFMETKNVFAIMIFL